MDTVEIAEICQLASLVSVFAKLRESNARIHLVKYTAKIYENLLSHFFGIIFVKIVFHHFEKYYISWKHFILIV